MRTCGTDDVGERAGALGCHASCRRQRTRRGFVHDEESTAAGVLMRHQSERLSDVLCAIDHHVLQRVAEQCIDGAFERAFHGQVIGHG
ncbi:MAG TPA: hypothetical protein VFO31_17320, partial [Vicinamibacterales bacterium]|nr:hypothetical protein [Vicinamibacterales bacterium]